LSSVLGLFQPWRTVFDRGWLEVTAVDILADAYEDLYRKYCLLEFPIKPIRGSGESLSEMFDGESFHCAYVRNALDHTHDIMRSFHNLVGLVRRGGYLILQHIVREGSKENWSGIHGWDIDLSTNGLIAYVSKGQEYRLLQDSDLEFSFVHYNCAELNGWVECVFKKLDTEKHG
jgi:SAM-dependent methyltransferase